MKDEVPGDKIELTDGEGDDGRDEELDSENEGQNLKSGLKEEWKSKKPEMAKGSATDNKHSGEPEMVGEVSAVDSRGTKL